MAIPPIPRRNPVTDQNGNVTQPWDSFFQAAKKQLEETAEATDLSAHLADGTDAHDASAISSVPSGNLSATNAQSALNELQTDIDTRATSAALTAHIDDTTDAHAGTAITNTPSGNLAATTVQGALNELQTDVDTRATSTALTDHISDSADAHAGSAITNTPSGNLAATTVQGALNELQADVDTRATSSALTAHIDDTTDAHDASAISVTPSGNLAADDVQEALTELQTDIDTRATSTALTDHTGDTSGAHAASAISFTPAGTIAATDAQSAIAEVATDAASALSTHEADTTSIHGITDTSTLLTTDNTKTVTNKTIDADSNTITNIENADIKAAAAIDAAKIADGSVSSAEFQYLNGVSSAIQTQLDAKASASSVSDHLGDTSDAHDASAISFSATGGIVATDVQAAIAELDTEKQPLDSDLTTIASLTATTDNFIQSKSSAWASRTPTQVTADLIAMVGDSGSGGTKGLVPAPGAGDAAALKFLMADGTWTTPEAGGSGGINYIDNYDAETDTTGWATYADAAGVAPVDGTGGSPNTTWTRSTSSPLRGSGSFLWTKSSGASRQGEGASYDFTIDTADKAKPLAITFDYMVASGTFTASDGRTAPANSGTTVTAGDSTIEVYLYDVTNAVFIPISPKVLTSNSTTTPNTFKGTFQTASNSTSYRLILHTAYVTDAAMTCKFDNFFVGPQAVAYGAAVGDWVQYTPTFTGFDTVSTQTFYWMRDGGDMIIRGTFTTGATPTATEGRISLPTGFTSGSNIGTLEIAGQWDVDVTSAFDTYYMALMEASKTYFTFGRRTSSSSAVSKANGNAIGGSKAVKVTNVRIPISGWSSNVLMSNDTDTRVVAARYYISGATLAVNTAQINFDTASFDTHGAVTTGASWKYTAPVSGIYRIGGLLTYNSGTNTELRLYKNGTVVCGLAYIDSTVSRNSFDTTISLVAGDYIDVRDTSNMTFYGVSSSIQFGYVNIERLSGPASIAATEKIFAQYTGNGGTALTASTTNIDFTTKVVDSHGAFSSNTTFTAPRAGWYNVVGCIKFTTSSNRGLFLYVNGTVKFMMNNPATWDANAISGGAYLNAGDTLTIRSDTNATLSNSATIHWISVTSQGGV